MMKFSLADAEGFDACHADGTKKLHLTVSGGTTLCGLPVDSVLRPADREPYEGSAPCDECELLANVEFVHVPAD